MLSIGLGFHVQAPLQDALRIVELRCQHAQGKVEAAVQEVARLRAHVTLVEEGIQELQGPMLG